MQINAKNDIAQLKKKNSEQIRHSKLFPVDDLIWAYVSVALLDWYIEFLIFINFGIGGVEKHLVKNK